MGKRKRFTRNDKRKISEEIESGYFGSGKYVVFIRDEQVPVYVVDDVGELPSGEKIRISVEHTT